MLAMLAFSEGTNGALAGGFEGGDGSGPIQRGAVAEHLYGAVVTRRRDQ